jgi:hypothetical protein
MNKYYPPLRHKLIRAFVLYGDNGTGRPYIDEYYYSNAIYDYSFNGVAISLETYRALNITLARYIRRVSLLFFGWNIVLADLTLTFQFKIGIIRDSQGVRLSLSQLMGRVANHVETAYILDDACRDNIIRISRILIAHHLRQHKPLSCYYDTRSHSIWHVCDSRVIDAHIVDDRYTVDKSAYFTKEYIYTRFNHDEVIYRVVLNTSDSIIVNSEFIEYVIVDVGHERRVQVKPMSLSL